MNTAFLGLGAIGRPMAARIAAAGLPLTVWNRTAERAAAFAAEANARQAATPADAVRDADVVITCFPESRNVHALLEGPEGLLAGMKRGSTLVDCTSGDPATSRAIAAALAAGGVDFLDAPVSGGVAGAEAGTLTIMLGGPAALVARARPLLAELGASLVHVGDRAGDGDAAKTINNMLSATNLAAAAEALAMGMRAGLDPRRLVECVSGGTGASHAMEHKVGGQVLTGRFASRFTLGQYLKDLGIARGLADDHRVPTPVNGAAHAAWTAHAARGAAGEDHTRLVALLVADAGIDHDWTAPDKEEAA
jgi:3-hydroxyisobutyrate dehydrogenase